ncbi:DUF2780 domain-containing protein [Pseudomonas sp. 10B1]|uniref:DUF2780 domain-containing protein n=1 Tax=unclassified Pseudomonas TaxID=196821 RepID=UPI002AB38073|nr:MULTISPECIES: DUF2780 domain-containing protein [unclassified Pseudomonas]MDY7562248.1 DUF2780 domain-containing protein [Pseudomonas sp. AB6]MEA9994829.1 DUF2780 domain-containing protein [Pseudomonas sp. AA4]MEB0086492.1 DUF2780 domain-containing protein [Pseudomonas sp. RTI1]MEB0126309.1 DUF2780 domain-containing protein [Pseudomonas sp. CCC1.2]MEB0153927.1 DUF2780 domain-containing protein [Pseudomonas sp. CCC4.3]
MQITRAVALATLMVSAATPVFAFNLSDVAGAVAGSTGVNQNAASTPQASGLLSALGSQLNVTPTQAVGGTGALMGLAQNKLSSGDYSALTKSVPGLDQLSGAGALSSLLGNAGGSSVSGTLDNVKSMTDVNSAFSKLGISGDTASQFAPVILKYLGDQGTSGTVLKSLSSIWGVGS